jgi:phosphoadenosine phosphosulfate reductase
MNAELKPDVDQLARWNEEVRALAPLEITRWAVARGAGRTIVSTNFRPYEAVVLHLAVQAAPEIPVLWVDHGYNRPATYRHAESLRNKLRLNLRTFVPQMTPARRDALHGPVPSIQDEAALTEFSELMKLEPFRRGMRELQPRVWITGLRRVQNLHRARMDIVTWDAALGVMKVNPVFYWDDPVMEAYLRHYELPNEWDYFDPAKAHEKRECGLHASGGSK